MDQNENDILRRVRKIEIKSRGCNQIFAGKYHSGSEGEASFRVRSMPGDDVRDIVGM